MKRSYIETHGTCSSAKKVLCVCPTKMVSQGRLVSSSPYCHGNCTFHWITTEFSEFGGNESNLHIALLFLQPEEVTKMKQTYTFSMSSGCHEKMVSGGKFYFLNELCEGMGGRQQWKVCLQNTEGFCLCNHSTNSPLIRCHWKKNNLSVKKCLKTHINMLVCNVAALQPWFCHRKTSGNHLYFGSSVED